jgi:hypothetical protein
VAEQRTDQRQGCTTGCQLRRKRMPQIMEAESCDSGGFAQFRPILFDLDAMAAVTIAGEYERAERPLMSGELFGSDVR